MQRNLLSERRRTAELPSQSLQGYYQGDLSGVFGELENVTKPRTATWQFVLVFKLAFALGDHTYAFQAGVVRCSGTGFSGLRQGA
jgi:hypothetical protein